MRRVSTAAAAATLSGRLVLRVRYPPHHHRHLTPSTLDGDGGWQPHGDGEALSAELAELLAWTLRGQGVLVELQPALRQLALFSS